MRNLEKFLESIKILVTKEEVEAIRQIWVYSVPPWFFSEEPTWKELRDPIPGQTHFPVLSTLQWIKKGWELTYFIRNNTWSISLNNLYITEDLLRKEEEAGFAGFSSLMRVHQNKYFWDRDPGSFFETAIDSEKETYDTARLVYQLEKASSQVCKSLREEEFFPADGILDTIISISHALLGNLDSLRVRLDQIEERK